MTPFELGWLVGILEGEGAFVSKLDNRQASIRVALTESDLSTLETLKRIAECGNVTGPYHYKATNKPHYIWSLQDHVGVWRLVHLIYPHMSKRRQSQLDKIIDYLKTRKKIKL